MNAGPAQKLARIDNNIAMSGATLSNVEDRLASVFNFRKRFSLPGQGSGLRDRFVITRSRQRTAALMVRAVRGVDYGQATHHTKNRPGSERE